MSARELPHAAIAEAADVVAEKIDVLLERATDAVLGTPTAGSPQWRQEWEARDSDAGRTAFELRARVKIAIAERAGIDTRPEGERERRGGVLGQGGAKGNGYRRRRSRESGSRDMQAECGQLAIW